ncbi:MAG: VWA domain-containing protein [Deltaproteobacteria bacterium]|nr:VWA domain-containing protein [Deltaproteobacteria bacterium]
MNRYLRPMAPILWMLFVAIPVLAVLAYIVEAFYEVPLKPDNFRFERPWALCLLGGALLVLIVKGFYYRRRLPRLRVSRGRDLAAIKQRGLRAWIKPAPAALRVVAVALLAVALAGPQSIHARDATEAEGIDIVLALDLSLSMQAADIRPNRFVATQVVVDHFITRRPNDRIGAVIFGREAYTLLPLTTDHQALRSMISELQLNMIDGQGTAIGNAIGVALNRLRHSQAKSKVVILATDGNSNSGNVSPTQAAEFAHTLGIKVYTILMGRSSDALIQKGTDIFGRPLFDRGNFPINPELLKKVASQTGGEAFQVADREGLERSFHTILDRLEKSQIEDIGRIYGELFSAFVWAALLLIAIEIVLGNSVLRRWP